MSNLTDWELDKYRRQIMIPGFGEEAQEKLKAASVLVSRVGGLGGPVAIWLAAAGVGKLVLGHAGIVTASNLNRQILMRGDGVGKPRAPQAQETILRFNPDCEVVAISDAPSPERAVEWVAQVDLACCSTPDFNERLWINDACVAAGKPLISPGMSDMEAQLTVHVPGKTPCLRCLMPEVPEWWEPYGFGVIGAVSGSVGAMAAMEIIKVITGFGTPLLGRLLVYDSLDLTFETYDLDRNPDCPACAHLFP